MKTPAKQNIFAHAFYCSLGLTFGTIIFGLMTDLATVNIIERCFFQVISIFMFSFSINMTHNLYKKEDVIDNIQPVLKQEKPIAKEKFKFF